MLFSGVVQAMNTQANNALRKQVVPQGTLINSRGLTVVQQSQQSHQQMPQLQQLRPLRVRRFLQRGSACFSRKTFSLNVGCDFAGDRSPRSPPPSPGRPAGEPLVEAAAAKAILKNTTYGNR